MTFGADARAIFDLLACDPDWFAVDVVAEIADELGALITANFGVPVRYLDDIYHVIPEPVVPCPHADVRVLTVADLPLLEREPELWGPWVGDAREVLAAGVVAGAVVDGRVVAIAQGAHRSDHHADIGVDTLEPWRLRGYSTAATALVAARVQALGKTPVWSCGAHNLASRRVAEKVGFVEVSRRKYVIRDAGRGTRDAE
jgi:predicted GNAT family acetyltransferase